MNPDTALRMVSDLLWTGLLVSAPVLAITMLVGIAISVLQVVTQIQDASLTFVPKLITAALCLMAFGGWMLLKLKQFSTQLWSSIPSLF